MASLPECRICAQIYNSKDRKPVILQSCGHTVCEECFNVLKVSGIITCPEDNKQSIQTEPVYNYEVISQIEKIEVQCDSCDNPSEYVCIGCMKFQCGGICNTSHNCPNKFQEDLTQFNLATLLIEKINLARQHRQAEPHRFSDIRKKTCAELKVELRREEEGQVFLEFCSDHPTLEGEFLDIETFTFKCKICELEERKKENEERKKCEFEGRPFQGRRLSLKGEGKDKAKELLNQLIQDRFVNKESFLIPPTLFKFIGTDEVSQLTKILKLLKSGKSFMPHCPKCFAKLTNETALKYPCAKAHLICRNCPQDRGVLKCIYDGNLYRNDNCKPIALETIYNQMPVCTICTESSDLRVLPCNHSFCTTCIAKTRRCPICNIPLSLDSSQYQVEPFLSCFTKLRCYNDDGDAVKISKQTGQVFCARCFTSENSIHTFHEIPARPHEFLDRLISKGLADAAKREAPDRNSSDLIFELRDMVASIPTASRELVGLLHQFPHISLSDRARLLYYVRTDLTNCDVDNTEECVGWRIPAITVPDFSVAMRFKDVVPPQFCQDISRPSRSPWHVDLEKRQIEIVGLTMFSPIQLHGIVMATSYSQGPSPDAALESFEIFNAQYFKEFGESLMLSYQCEELYSFHERQSLTGPLNHKIVMFPKPFDFVQEEPYILKFRLSGSKTFYRGNSATLDEHRAVFGPDGTFLTFLGCLCVTDDFVDGKNHLSGALLGLIYKSPLN